MAEVGVISFGPIIHLSIPLFVYFFCTSVLLVMSAFTELTFILRSLIILLISSNMKLSSAVCHLYFIPLRLLIEIYLFSLCSSQDRWKPAIKNPGELLFVFCLPGSEI